MHSKFHQHASLLCVATLGCTAAAASDVEITSSLAHSGPEFNFIGFADVNYISADGADPDGFAIGQAVGHIVASLDESLSVFGEITATAQDSDYAFEVERLIVKYDFSDRYKLSAGRYHTPIGYWNSAFHHGAWLQTTTSRPEVAKFGSKILPIHFVGILLEGNLPSDDLGLEYKAGFGNGRHANISRGGDAGDINGDKAWMVQLLAKPRDWNGFNAGIGFYSDEITLPDRPNVRESTLSVHAVWGNESPEILFEYIHSTHEQVTDSSIEGDVDAWYAQFAYRLKGKRRAWKPYARVEHTRVDASDPLLGSEGLDYDGGILGLRWDFSSYATLKAEYRNEEFDNGGREHNFRVQLAIVLTDL